VDSQNVAPAFTSHWFVDADEYHSAIRGGDGLLTFLSGGTFRGELKTIRIGQVTLQRGSENLPRLSATCMPSNTVGILGWVGDSPLPIVRGVQIQPGEWMSLGRGMQSHHRTAGPVNYVALTVDADHLAQAAIALTGMPVAVTPGKLLRVPDELGAWLLAVIEAAVRAAETTDGIFSSPLAADALEQALLRPMIMCLLHGGATVQDLPRCRGAVVVKQFEEAVEARLEDPPTIPDLCRSLGVCERTLRVFCQEQLGVSPLRFMMLRRLHLTRRMLLRADRHSATVTQIAMDHGFWEMGRFAVTYRALFDESPSATLRRPPFT
jgi:AraC-like DNA-binding protein